jgi:hypothetical protein
MPGLSEHPTVGDCRIIPLPRIEDLRGNLTFVEADEHIPFAIRRVYWIYDVPGGAIRGAHGYSTNQEFIIAMSGSFDVVLDDGISKRVVALNRSYFGLYVPNLIWRQLANFSTNAVCLILASTDYAESDYLRDYAELVAARAGDA